MRSRILSIVTALLTLSLCVALISCGETPNYDLENMDKVGASRDELEKKDFELELPANLDIESYRDPFPEQVSEFLDKSHAGEKEDYLETYPWLKNVYEGSGFAKGWDSPSPHPGALESALASPRVSEKAPSGCYSCKTSAYQTAEEPLKSNLETKPMLENKEAMKDGFSCYDCHMNRPGKDESSGGKGYTGTSRQNFAQYFPDAYSGDAVCGQCHSEHYITENTNVLDIPELTDPTELLAHYDSIDYFDHENPRTGAKMLKAQHPEWQVCYTGSHYGKATCSSCHMEKAADGKRTIHYITSPSKSDPILEKVCQPCHMGLRTDDLKLMISSVQEHYLERKATTGESIAAFNDKFAAAVEGGKLSADELAQLQKIQREATWYWDWIFTENSEGVHNPTLARECLDKADALVTEGNTLLK
jgi:nitrite reductase (cytochrome c-552)